MQSATPLPSNLRACDFLRYAYRVCAQVEIQILAGKEPIDDEDILTLLPSSYDMKIVIIDGFFAGKNLDLDLRDYEAVKNYFGLKN